METTYQKIHDEVQPYLNQLVLDGSFYVCKLIGVSQDDEDIYYIFQYPGKRHHQFDHNKGIVHSSAVGTFFPLKGKIDESHYNELERLWEINEPHWK